MTLLAAGALAIGCSAGPGRSATRVAPPKSAQAPLPKMVSRSDSQKQKSIDQDCTDDSQCQTLGLPKLQGRRRLCERGRCESYDVKYLWQWAVGSFPSLRDINSVSAEFVDAPWFASPEPIKLYLPENWRTGEALSRRSHCVRLNFSKSDGELVAKVEHDGRPWKGGALECSSGIYLGLYARVGQTGECPIGGDTTELSGNLTLSRADESGLEYNGATIKLEPQCRSLSVERTGCEPASCTSCRLIFDVKYVSPPGSTHWGAETSTKIADDACSPCLPDPIAALVPRLKAIVEPMEFTVPHLEDNADALRLFTDRAACEAQVQTLVESRRNAQ